MSTGSDGEQYAHALVRDHSLVLRTEGSCWSLVRPWLPLSCSPADETAVPRATITVTSQPTPTTPPPDTGRSTLRVGSVHAWIDGDAGSASLGGVTDCWCRLDLRELDATLAATIDAGEAASNDVYFMLTIASALLLGRMSRALIHAGAVVTPNGSAWLVVGDAQSGKSTTCVSLASTGCRLLSDDQMVLAPSGGTIDVEGWLRPVHLDEGWSAGTPRGRRRSVHPSKFGTTERGQAARLAGSLHTSVVRDEPTRVTEMSASEALTGLVRQSPWLLADRAAAPGMVETLSAAARLPRYSLRAGLDTFGRPDRLRTLLEPVLS